jgi:RNA polymerase sigma factor for flagellar operon FliA
MQAAPQTALRAKASEVYARQSRETVEQRWILDHLPLVRHVVSKVTGSLSCAGDVEDLISAGTLGLVKAARAFDPTRHSEFKTYAYIRIRGAVLDELRGRSFVPASVHGQVRKIRRAYEALAAEKGLPASDEDLAARAGISLRELYRTLSEARKQNFMSIHGLDDDAPVLGSFLPADGHETPDAQAERSELLESLAAAIRQLPRRDRLVLLLYYERDLTMKETAEVLGITESRVSQIHASALFKLSMKLRNAT